MKITNLIASWFNKKPTEKPNTQVANKYLIAGLGNVGAEYEGTRHNVGFMVVDALAKTNDAKWTLERHAYRTEVRCKGRTLVLIKPTTYMNLSGKAVRYWLQAEHIDQANLLVVLDDIALEVGALRMKKQGSDGGHNGLTDIDQALGNNNYCRLRVGVGHNFSRGQQIDYVLGQFSTEEQAILQPRIDTATEMVKSFATIGADRTMNLFNGK
ncbi:MAG: aminoacyl-tRNA hydrolase [Bacteroidales bacterium]|nr:aminoacyl-tRNA hydrolase [Bacteroidales bacterium]